MANSSGLVKQVRRHTVPAWWTDAKLGIFIHWTPASVPAFAPKGEPVSGLLANGRQDAMAYMPYSEWYENSLRYKDSPVARHHAEHYGHRGYAEFAGEWEAALPNWDPDGWAEQFASAGARYVVLVAKHHDGYCLWPTAVTNPHRRTWHCKRDVVGELAEAVRAKGMRFGLYYSGGLDWTFNDHPIGTFSDLMTGQPRGDYIAYADAQLRELVDRYKPSVLWNDISWPGTTAHLARLFADFYKSVPEGVVNDRFMPWSPPLALVRTRAGSKVLDRFAAKAAKQDKGVVPPKPPLYDFRTPEYTVFGDIQRQPWECVRGIDGGFGYNAAATEADHIPRNELAWGLIDVVAKGGNLLLNVGPRGVDATIPEMQAERLSWLGELTRSGGQGLYATRPWVRASSVGDGADLRYTTRDRQLFVWARPDGRSSIDEVFVPGVQADGTAGASDGEGQPLSVSVAGNGIRIVLAEPATLDQPALVALTGVSARGE